jgi:hypothetical protein
LDCGILRICLGKNISVFLVWQLTYYPNISS